MKEKTISKTPSAIDSLGYALYAFGGLGMELLLIMAETNFYGCSNDAWSDKQNIIHWLLTCFIWGLLGWLLYKQLPVATKNNIQRPKWIATLILMGICIVSTSLVWNGWKPMIEFTRLGTVKFIIQYLYYAFESLLILLMIAYGQKAFELWFHHSKVPWGGILLAITWGLIHILTQGSATGLYTVIQSLLYGSIYLLLQKDFKRSYLVIAFLFMV